MGDLLLSTAVLPLIRKRFPRAHLAMMVQPYTAELLAGNPNLDEVIIYRRGGFLRQLAGLRRQRFDTAVVLYPRPAIALLLLLAGVKRRIGTSRRWYSFLFNARVAVRRARMDKHELEYNVDLLAPLGIRRGEAKLAPAFHLSEAEKKWGGEYLAKKGVKSGAKAVILHPGGFGSALLWPAAHYAALVKKLSALRQVRVVLAGGPREKKLLAAIERGAGAAAPLIAAQLSLRQYAAVMDKARLFVSASTGPMHLAACLQPRLVSIFCPIRDCTPRRWGPYSANATVLLPRLPECGECKPRDCEHHPCMEKLSPEVVFEACRKELER